MLQLDTKKNEIATGFFEWNKKKDNHQKGHNKSTLFSYSNFCADI